MMVVTHCPEAGGGGGGGDRTADAAGVQERHDGERTPPSPLRRDDRNSDGNGARVAIGIEWVVDGEPAARADGPTVVNAAAGAAEDAAAVATAVAWLLHPAPPFSTAGNSDSSSNIASDNNSNSSSHRNIASNNVDPATAAAMAAAPRGVASSATATSTATSDNDNNDSNSTRVTASFAAANVHADVTTTGGGGGGLLEQQQRLNDEPQRQLQRRQRRHPRRRPGPRQPQPQHHRAAPAPGSATHRSSAVHRSPPPPPPQPPLAPHYYVPVAELQPQLLPEAEQQPPPPPPTPDGVTAAVVHVPDNGDDPDVAPRFQCPICCDVLHRPVGCGTCAGRFCEPCLQRVLEEQQPPPQPHNSAASHVTTAQCPLCRASFAAGAPDTALRRDMESRTVPCRHAACTGADGQRTVLRLSDYQHHEVTVCGGVRVACRYAVYGCEWQGPRSEVYQHDGSDCPYAKMTGLLEKLRISHCQHYRDVQQLQQHVSSLRAVLHAVDRGVHEAVVGDAANAWHVLAYATAATLTTPRGLLRNRLPWKPLYHTPEARAAVFNTLALLPTLVLAVKLVVRGLHRHVREWTWNKVVVLLQQTLPFFFVESGPSSACASESTDAVNGLWVDLLMTWMIAMYGCLLLLCFYGDTASSRSWQMVDVRRRVAVSPGSVPPDRSRDCRNLVEYAVSGWIFLLYLTAADISDHGFASILTWSAAAVGSWVLPAALHCISILTAADDDAAAAHSSGGLLRQCRVLRPLFIGMKYAVLVSQLGVWPCLNAIALSVCVLRDGRKFLRVGSFEMFYPFVDIASFLNVKKNVVGASYVPARLAYVAWEHHRQHGEIAGEIAQELFPFLAAFCLCVIVDVFCQPLTVLGYYLGKEIYAKAKHTLLLAQRNSGGTHSRVPPTTSDATIGLGVLVFALWITSLAVIAVV